MSELINNNLLKRKQKLKELILSLHHGTPEHQVRQELIETLSQIPYNDVVEVEQELISEGLPVEEVLRLCDVHAAVLEGNVDLSAVAPIPENHPIDVMVRENLELKKVAKQAKESLESIILLKTDDIQGEILKLRAHFNALYDVDKHYLRKEYLLFPFMEQHGITGPPKVMWGKHDQIRELIKGAIEILAIPEVSVDELSASADLVIIPAIQQVVDMTSKEEEILFPMALEVLTEKQWYDIQRQALEFGYCLYDPPGLWKPSFVTEEEISEASLHKGNIQLPSGQFTVEELLAILNHLPIDMTFVDKNDKVKYFSQGKERVFHRNRAILNRDVRFCHPPSSAHIVDKIIEDFKSGKEDSAPFWINMRGQMVHIDYFALRNEKGEYLGTLEVSHNVQKYRNLEGEQRILSYEKKEKK
ncbi:MAG: DUF438 domain-containing protein [Fibrobacter sp.]|nr:DUF438 domain-containing protein [Fibrobacter sp.]